MRKKIEANWKAIENVENEVRKQTNDPEARFNAGTFFLGGGGRELMIPCLYRTKKGEKYSKSYKEMMVFAEYCPFTGKPLYEDSITEAL